MYCSRECLDSDSSPRGSESSASGRRRSSESNTEQPRTLAQELKTAPAVPAAMLIRQDEKFLYDSPLLKPQQTTLSVSPPLSPLLIAQGAGETNLGTSVSRLSQSSSSYRKWLKNEN